MSYTGQPLKRLEDPRLLTGKGSFVDDLQLPDMIYACVLRSPHAHASLRRIEVAAARLLPDVVAVLTGDDIAHVLPDIPTRAMAGEWQVEEMRAPEQPVLAKGKVCYVGQPVAVVVARERSVARDAVDRIQVDYAPLPPLLDPLAAAQADATPIHAHLGTNIALRITHDRQGHDLDAAFARADRVVRQRYDVQRLAPVRWKRVVSWPTTTPKRISSRSGPPPRAHTGCGGNWPSSSTGPRAGCASSRQMSEVVLGRRVACSPKMWPSRTSL